MRAELIGRRDAPTERFTLKRRSGKGVEERERLELGSRRRDGVRVETLDCDEKVEFERRPSGSAGPRTADEAMLAALSINEMIILMVKLEDDLGAPRK